MLTVVVLGTTAYSSNGTPYSGFSGTTLAWGPSRFFDLNLQFSDENYSMIAFTVIGCGSAAPFPAGLSVQVFFCANNGTSPVNVFTGDLESPQKADSNNGPAWAYSGYDLKWRADQLTMLSSSGLAVASYNLPITDPNYAFALAGQTVGAIVTDILQATTNAASLAGYGVGNYSIFGGIYTLPSITVSDLAALSIVPNTAVQLQGESILSRLQQFIRHWHSQYTLFVDATGNIRVVPLFGRTQYTLTQPNGATGAGDPVDNLLYNVDLKGCFGAVQILGQNIGWAVGSLVDGTLSSASTTMQYSTWTSLSFNSPSNSNNVNNALDTGTLSAVTTVSCTVKSDNPHASWSNNFWNDNGGVIQVINTAVVGIDIQNTVQITSSSAMTAGGTANITWSSSTPLGSTAYTHYRMYATATPESLVDRAWYWTEPGGTPGMNTGLDTYIGSHMVPYSSFGYAWGIQGKGIALGGVINYPTCAILWSQTGQPPYQINTIPATVNPTNGTIVLAWPACFNSAMDAGTSPSLASGFPKTYTQGLYYDVQIAFPYNAGNLGTRYPASGFQGTAYTVYGRQLVKTIALPNFIFSGDAPALNQLAEQYLLTIQNYVCVGTIRLHFDDWTPTFNPYQLGYALNIVTPGDASPLDGQDLPVRSVEYSWPHEGADRHLVTFSFNNRHREFEGDSLFIHPSFAPQSWGNAEDLFSGGGGGVQGTFGALANVGSEFDPSGLDIASMAGGAVGASGAASDQGGNAFGRMGLKSSQEMKKAAMEQRVADRKDKGPSREKGQEVSERNASNAETLRTARAVPEPDVAGAQYDQGPKLSEQRGHHKDTEQGGE